jgi:hypothetical protein
MSAVQADVVKLDYHPSARLTAEQYLNALMSYNAFKVEKLSSGWRVCHRDAVRYFTNFDAMIAWQEARHKAACRLPKSVVTSLPLP